MTASPQKIVHTNSEIAAAVQMSKAAIHGSPLKKSSSGPYLNKKPLTHDKRTTSSEEEELREIYEQQRLDKEIAKKKGDQKIEKKGSEYRKEERKKKKKKKKDGRQTVIRDSYADDSRRIKRSRTKVCAIM
ncbi:hypothetical protein QR680_006944 [Steinernema hermaphroditum]|uniref:Uncharacterized protein n=1 Tax=Steinernema hermaphroditum TaxID=289476 RepID=A0AA39LXX9_9BILA|nr:hypothetical protein QR680_006944 [Steinernema hermaphroditum]